MYSEGEGLRGISKVLNQQGVPSPRAGKRGTGSWSPTVVRPILRRERYHGVLVYGVTKKTYRGGTKVRIKRSPNEVIRVERPDLKIVPDDLWERVDERFRRNCRKSWRVATGRKPKHLLSSLARCSTCGGPTTPEAARSASSRPRSTCAATSTTAPPAPTPCVAPWPRPTPAASSGSRTTSSGKKLSWRS